MPRHREKMANRKPEPAGAPRGCWWAVAVFGLVTLVAGVAAAMILLMMFDVPLSDQPPKWATDEAYRIRDEALVWAAIGAVAWSMLVRRHRPRGLWAFLWLGFWCPPGLIAAIQAASWFGERVSPLWACLGIFALLFLSQLWVALEVMRFQPSSDGDDGDAPPASED